MIGFFLNLKIEDSTIDENFKSYAGKYKYSDKEIMEVSYENKNLYVKSSVASRNINSTVYNTKFRIPDHSGDGTCILT
jgi:hypothetical protein